MANQIFAEAIMAAWRGQIDLDNDEIRAALVDSGAGWTPDQGFGGDDLLDDIATNAILSMATLTGTSWAAGVFDAADFAETFPDHGGGATGEWLLIYQHKPQSRAITAVNQGNKTFTIQEGAGNALDPMDGMLIEVQGSTGNDGFYNIDSFTYSNPDTIITVFESIPSATADGNLILSDRNQSRLIALVDSATGLPITFDGTDDSITWNGSGIIQRLTVCP